MIEAKPESIIRATLSSLAKLLSVKDDQIEDALASEKLAKRQLSRRGLFLGSAAAVAAVALPTGLVASAPTEHIIAMYAAWKWTHVDGSQIQVSVQP